MNYYDIDQIKTANRRAGQHFFDASALRFFRSRVSDTVYQGVGGVFFVTSEQFRDSAGRDHERLYTVRKFEPETARVNTVGDFCRMSKSAAHRAAKKLAETAA